MSLGDRILERLKELGMSQAELARRVGITQPSINHLIRKGAGGSAHLHRIAAVLETTVEYLIGETDDPSSQAGVSDRRAGFRGDVVPPDTIELDEFDVSYGLGAAFIHESAVSRRKRVFSRSWIRQFTDSPFDQLFWATGNGDSMEPKIQDADVVLIDGANRTPRQWDKIWAVEVGGLGAIKRLRPTKDGKGIRMLSDGGQPEEVCYDDELTVIGRVCAIVRKV